MSESPRVQTALATDALSELVGVLLSTSSVNEVLDQLAKLAASLVSPPAPVGVTLRREHGPFTVATTDTLAALVDEVQYGKDEGPCLETLRTGAVTTVEDLAVETRWPQYRPHALAHGVRSSLSLPLQVDGTTVAALNLYGLAPRTFGADILTRALALADQGTTALSLAIRQAQQAELSEQLRDALASRTVIDQAMGILMGQQRCPASEAFALLRAASQHRNRKLRDVAADIVTAVSGAPPEPPPPFRIGS
jgi:GAF domain-containing protein